MALVRPSILAALSLLTFAGRAHADGGASDAAREAYSQGAAAYEAHDFARASTLLAQADELLPNPVVLKLALAASLQADDPVVGMALVLRAEKRAVDGSLADLAHDGRGRFEGRVGLVRVACAGHRRCRAHVGAQAAGDGERIVAAPGAVEVVFDEPVRTVHVTVAAKTTTDAVEPALPPVHTASQPAPPPAREPSGLSPAFFWAGAGASAILGGLTGVSALDGKSQHDEFLLAARRTPDAKDRGQDAETRTNVLLAATLITAAATSVVGLFFTRWHRVPQAAGAATIAVF